jgi:hypothetical protein
MLVELAIASFLGIGDFAHLEFGKPIAQRNEG